MKTTLVFFAGGLALLTSCSSKDNPATPATDAGADGAVAFAYTPAGCAYQVSPPESRGFAELLRDDVSVGGGAPQRVRIGLGGGTNSGAPGYADPATSAVFTWETIEPSGAKVRLGTDPKVLTDVHAGYSWTTPAPTVGLGTEEPAPRLHEVHVCGLAAGKTYYYQVGGGAPEVWSETQTFTTVPSAAQGGKITLGVSGDSRDSADIFQMVQLRMRDAAVAMQLFTGDAVLVGGQESLYGAFLDKAWRDPTDPKKFLTLGQQMIVATAGNHENESAQFYGNFAIPGDGPNAETYASFDVGSAHIVVLDDQSIALSATSDAATEQLAWVDQDLARAEANRSKTPLLIVVHHRGELSTSTHATDSDMVAMRSALMPIWDRHHVDLVVSGHDHDYERSKPATGPATKPTVQSAATSGTTYVVCAGAGASGYAPGTVAAPYREKSVGFGAGKAGSPYVGLYSLITLEGRKLTFTAYGLKASSKTVAADDVIDTFELAR